MLAASIAYAAVVSLFPLLVGLIILLSRLVAREPAQRAVVSGLTPYLPPAALAMVQNTFTAVAPVQGTVGVLATLGLFWVATAVASAIRHSLNRVLRVRRDRPFWRRKLVELGVVVLVGGFMSLSLLAGAVADTLGMAGPLATAAALFHNYHLVSSWIFPGLVFLAIYRFLPYARLPWRSLLVGSVTSLLLFQGIEHAFFWYLRTLARYPLVYEPLVGVVVFMVWVYLAAVVLLIGAVVMMQVAIPNGTQQAHASAGTGTARDDTSAAHLVPAAHAAKTVLAILAVLAVATLPARAATGQAVVGQVVCSGRSSNRAELLRWKEVRNQDGNSRQRENSRLSQYGKETTSLTGRPAIARRACKRAPASAC
jgi:membrane protein